MKTKLSLKERYKLFRKFHKTYKKATKKEKGKLLNFLTESTGLNRKRIIQIFKQGKFTIKRKKRKVKSKYREDKELKKHLVKIWKTKR